MRLVLPRRVNDSGHCEPHSLSIAQGVARSASSPAILKGVLRPEVPVLQIALHLLQLVRPQALVNAGGQRVTQRGDNVPVAVEAHLLARLKAGVKEPKVRDNLQRKEKWHQNATCKWCLCTFE